MTTLHSSNVTTAANYQLQPQLFVNQLTNCFDDENCRILYYHFGKSGGTGVFQRMHHIFPPRIASCCNDGMMARFWKDPEKHCSLKFSSYEVSSTNFLRDILPTCQNITRTSSLNARAVVLVSFREPVSRTLSYIHQLCNKNLGKRTPQQRLACRHCSYKQDANVYWNSFLEGANRQYQQVYQVASSTRHPVLAIDVVDLSDLYRDLYYATSHEAFNTSFPSNPESTRNCNFGVTSEMFRALRPAIDVYRNLTLGRYNPDIA